MFRNKFQFFTCVIVAPKARKNSVFYWRIKGKLKCNFRAEGTKKIGFLGVNWNYVLLFAPKARFFSLFVQYSKFKYNFRAEGANFLVFFVVN